MFWKIYAWIYVVITALGMLVLIPVVGSWNFASWEGALESVLLATGAFVFAYRTQLFNELAWKIIFTAILVVWIADIIYYSTNAEFLSFLRVNSIGEHGLGSVLFSIILSIPALIAIYRIGFRREKYSPVSNSDRVVRTN